MEFLGNLRKELELKVYQYELTFGLYMLNKWEKAVLSKTYNLMLTEGWLTHLATRHTGAHVWTVFYLCLLLPGSWTIEVHD